MFNANENYGSPQTYSSALQSATPSSTRDRKQYPMVTPSQEEPMFMSPLQEEDVPEIAIAVMGATGSGKSTFINLVSGSDLPVSDDIISCTDAVHITDTFSVDGRSVVLIDTPGFDDTTRSDTDVLKMIAAFLETSYEQGATLAGILYFHRISDVRVGGALRRNFNMFRKLCGDDPLKNVVIVTNMWKNVDPRTGDKREIRLRGSDTYFKPVLDKGARITRHDDTASSAENIIRLVLENHPLPLRIQEELVIEGKDITQTGAGKELNQAQTEQIRKYKEQLDEAMKEMQEAMSEENEGLKRELKERTEEIEREITKFQKDRERLASDYKKEKERLEAHVKQMESEWKKGMERQQKQIEDLKELFRSMRIATSESEKDQKRKKINELTGKTGRGFLPKLKRLLSGDLLG